MPFISFMGRCEPEEVRCRVYGGDQGEAEKIDFIERLRGAGVIDCPAYDQWVEALQTEGWLPEQPDLEPNPDGPGRIGRWRLTPKGREAWARMRGS